MTRLDVEAKVLRRTSCGSQFPEAGRGGADPALRWQAELCEFTASLLYIGHPRPARATCMHTYRYDCMIKYVYILEAREIAQR